MVVRAVQGRESESSRLFVDECCKEIPRIFTIQYGSESTSESYSLGGVEAMNRTKKLSLMASTRI